MKLKNFEPYNDLDYFGCYYKTIFHIMNYFNIDIFRFLVNHFYVFQYRKEDKFSFFLTTKTSDGDMFEKSGLLREKISIDDKPVLQIQKSIKSGKPVMLRIDCYYLPFRIDTYNKVHTYHYICIYGFNDKNKNFNVIDHNYVNSFEYKKHELSYESFNAYVNNYADNDLYFYAFSKNNSVDQDDKSYIQEYSKLITKNTSILYDGINCLEDFIHFFIDEITGPNCKIFIENVMIVIVNITRCVKQRNDLLKAYIFASDLIEYLETIAKKWTIIRSILIKTFRYDENKQYGLISDLSKYIYEVFEMEKEFNNEFIEYCKNNIKN